MNPPHGIVAAGVEGVLELADQQQRLVVPLCSMAGNAFLKQPANHVERFGGMFLEFRLESLDTKLLTPSIRGLEQTVGSRD